MYQAKKSIICLFLSTAIILGCTSNKGKLEDVGAPEWVFNPTSVAKDDQEISAVGIGEPTKAGLKTQIAQAEADARANLGSQILSDVSRISKDAVRKTSIANIEDVEKIFSQASRNVVDNLPLSGSRRTHIWQDPKTDTLYIRVSMNGKNVASHIRDSLDIYSKKLRDSAVSDTQVGSLMSEFEKGVGERFSTKDVLVEKKGITGNNKVVSGNEQ